MDRSKEENMLRLCRSRCSGLKSDLKSVDQLQHLQGQIKTFRCSLKKMDKVLRSYDFNSSESDPTKHPGLSLLAVYLFNLRNTFGYYGMNNTTTWRLNSEQRESALNGTKRPFERLADKLHSFAKELYVISSDKRTDGQEKAENLSQWAESMIKHWEFFTSEFGAARGMAAAVSAVKRYHLTSPGTFTPESPINFCNYKKENYHEPDRTRGRRRIRGELAAEGIDNDATAKVAEDLKSCVRDFVRRQRPEASSDELELTDDTASTSRSTASDENYADLVDSDAINTKVTAALEKIDTDFNENANEILTIAVELGKKQKPNEFRKVLDVIYFTACHDTTRARSMAKLAKHIQDHVTVEIQEMVMTKRQAKMKAEGDDSAKAPGPVTRYYLGRFWEAWARGRNGSHGFNAEDWAFGLPQFMCDLAKVGVFGSHNIHAFVRSKLKPTVGKHEFVAVYQLLRTMSGRCEGYHMRSHFEKIASLVDNEATPNSVKALARELQYVRESKWKYRQSQEIDRVRKEMQKKKT